MYVRNGEAATNMKIQDYLPRFVAAEQEGQAGTHRHRGEPFSLHFSLNETN
jgi:hypothetical protein